MKRKIIFLDVDGTLVDYENNLPNSAVRAIREARNKGHKIYVSTGRAKAEMQDHVWDIGLDGMIGGNGAYVESDGHVVFHKTLTLEQCTKVVDWLHSRKLEFYLESNNGLFASENFAKISKPVFKKYMGLDDDSSFNEHVEEFLPGMVFGEELYRDDVLKISYILDSYQDYVDSTTEFPDLNAGTWGGKGEEALFGDLGVKDISKAYAIDCLLEYLEADVSDTIAFGDATVDIPMLEYCTIGVAMGNGSEEVKEAADYITDNVEDDGLYKAFIKLNLIKK